MGSAEGASGYMMSLFAAGHVKQSYFDLLGLVVSGSEKLPTYSHLALIGRHYVWLQGRQVMTGISLNCPLKLR